MKLLLLTHDWTDPSFRIRWERFFPEFARAGIETQASEIPARGRRSVLRQAGSFDVTVLHRRLLGARDLAYLRGRARFLAYDFDDALFHRPRPPFRSKKRERRFFATMRHADLVFAGNRYLATVARLRARRVLVAPSTVDPAPAVPEAGVDRFTAVWIGQRATLPHLAPVLPALLDAGIRVRVIADAAPPGVEHVPWSLETQDARLAECHAGLAPLPSDRFARGKCGYKLLQYYAAGLPAVASPVGVHRVLAGGGALLARTPSGWVAACRRLEADPDLRARLGARGRGFAARRYAARSLAERLVRVLSSCGR